MDTETVGIIGLFGLLFVAGTVLSLVFALARKPFERLIDKIVPGGRFSSQISRGMRITVGPDPDSPGGETFSVNLASGPPPEMIDIDRSARRPLSDAERSRYLEEWERIHRSFRDDPANAVRAADELLKDLVKRQGGAQVSLRRMHKSSGDAAELGAAIIDAYNFARNAHDAARGIALSTAEENASVEELTNVISYYEVLFNDLLVREHEVTTPSLPGVSIRSVEVHQGFPWTKSRDTRVLQHPENPAEPALRAIATKLEILLSIVLGALVLIIPSVAILIMATMAEGTRAQGGRFYVAIAALAVLGVVNSQIGRILRRRAPGITPSPDERRHAALSLILFPICAFLLIGLAWRLP
jgi:hypothetical protein